jgi:hypothetical protein
MRVLSGFCIALLFSGALFAQYGNRGPAVRGSFGSVLYPGGTSATTPGLTRFNGSVVYPGGGGPLAGQNFRRPVGQQGFGGRIGGVYAYPVYVGGYGYGYGYGYSPDAGYLPDGSYGAYGAYPPDAAGAAPQQSPPSSVIVIYPQQTPPPMVAPNGQAPGAAPGPPPAYAAPQTAEPADNSVSVLDPSHYLIAFKDHTIYSAVAYWVEGDTLHYFTSGNTHNQASLELVDRPLTERLNRESGVDMRLPPASSGK